MSMPRPCRRGFPAALLLTTAPTLAAQPLFDAVPESTEIQLVDGGLTDDAYPVTVQGHAGWMNRAGQLTVEPRYDWTDHPYDGVARVVVDGFTGYRAVGATGPRAADSSWLVEPVLEFGDRFSEGLAVIGDGRHFGYLGTTGETVVPIQYDDARRFSEGLAAVRLRDRCGFIDSVGDVVVPLRYASVRDFRAGFAVVERPAARRGVPGVLGYIDRQGVDVLIDRDGRFASLGDFSDAGLAPAQDAATEQWGYLDRAFGWAIQPQFTAARPFVNDRAAVRVNGRWGHIDPTGAWAVDPEFDEAGDFTGVLALVRIGDGYGYIDRDGLTAIAPQFHEAEPFARGLARGWLAEGAGYVDVRGTVVWSPRVAQRGFRDLRAAAQQGAGTPPLVRAPAARRATRAYPPDAAYDPSLAASRRR